MNEITDQEVFQIMIDGGEKLCDYALTQWISGKYCGPRPWSESDEDMRQENIRRWNKIKGKIRPLAKKMRSRYEYTIITN